MAYNVRNFEKRVAFIMRQYKAWKSKNEDIPDTYFVRVILRDLGHEMTYGNFMRCYKHRSKTRKISSSKQLNLF